jgi:hypothetical protein
MISCVVILLWTYLMTVIPEMRFYKFHWQLWLLSCIPLYHSLRSSSQSGWLLRTIVISIWLTVTNGRHLNLVDCYERSSSQSGWLSRTVVISIWLTVTNGRHLNLVDCYERWSSQSGWLLRTVVISIWLTVTNGRHLTLVVY